MFGSHCFHLSARWDPEDVYSVFRTACLLPSVISKLDDVLLVKELNAKYFDHSVAEHHLLAAISSPATLSDIDYERLELLGAT